MNRGKWGTPARPDSGAAAVEFALVSTMLFLLLFGIVQFGLYFNDSLNARSGVREAARMSVVRNFPTTGACVASDTDLVKAKCNAKAQISALVGTTYVKVVAPAWVKGNALKVCTMISEDAALGLLPMPNGGWIKNSVQMSIEQDATPVPTGTSATASTSSADTLPSGQNWNWCT